MRVRKVKVMAHLFRRRSSAQQLERRAQSAPFGSDKRLNRDLVTVAGRVNEDFHDAEEACVCSFILLQEFLL